jgi:PAS domain S-box-containing protein
MTKKTIVILRRKIFTLFILVAIIPLSVFAYLTYNYHYNHIETIEKEISSNFDIHIRIGNCSKQDSIEELPCINKEYFNENVLKSFLYFGSISFLFMVILVIFAYKLILNKISIFNQAIDNIKSNTHDDIQNSKTSLLTETISKLADIQKENAQALQHSENKFYAIFNQTFQFIGILDRHGILLEINEVALQSINANRKEVLNKYFWETKWWEHSTELADKVKHAVIKAIDGEFVRFETFHIDPNGKPFYIDFSLKPIKNKFNKLCMIIPEGRDITKYKLLEIALRRERDFNTALVQSSPVFIIIIDFRGKIKMINNTMLQTLGYGITDMVGQDYRKVFVTEVDQQLLSDLFKMIIAHKDADKKEENNVTQNLVLTRSGEELFIEWHVNPVYDEERKIDYFISVGIDITKRQSAERVLYEYHKILESQIIEQTAALSNSNKKLELEIQERIQTEQALQKAKEIAEVANHAKSVFLANMSHELRSPLNAILGFSQLMQRSQDLSVNDRKNINIINNSGEHLLNLINQVLDLSKIEAQRITINNLDFDLYHLLDDINNMLKMKIHEKNLEFIFICCDNVPQYIHADEIKLRQILINLINNALKFTKEGGIYIRINNEINDNNCHIKFEVKDSGVGIAKEELGNLFKAFVQTASGKRVSEGTGLGLTISRKFIQLMGGDISVESEVNKGTSFKFNIKVTLAESNDIIKQKQLDRVIGLVAGQANYRILIVDDKEINRQLLVDLLKPLGFQTKEAVNGKQSVEMWEQWQPHLIWMDIRMPVMDGYEATKIIKATENGQNTAIIALTASTFDEEREFVTSAGCDDFMRKPYHEEEIFTMMQKHLGINYICDNDNEDIPANNLETNAENDLSNIPSELLNKLEEAANRIDMDEIDKIISEISVINNELAENLTKLSNNFQYDEIVKMIT